ncbi:importin subunit alpha-4, putative [Entamoeba invadens IP1]|uniref:importin subunit alpha-4, putative n=1 Tax=Entamoeba invadens IP1 TaxID=370355 RepID=UPI0002C3F5FE|nr:importin subunit alpha-4, putative [Entamoeba invadens IP1]ELP90512.1 importin subunit alpha-4, putative [Entamoeba invadens IP1]|eukprot:XP_004257283.1 importin subunit alpha-4, putative [Entamoeba invadens IP1]
MSHLRATPNKETTLAAFRSEFQSMRHMRREDAMKARRAFITDPIDNIPVFDTTRDVIQICDQLLSGNLTLIEPLRKCLCEDSAICDILIQKNVTPFLLLQMKNNNDYKIAMNVLRYFVDFTALNNVCAEATVASGFINVVPNLVQSKDIGLTYYTFLVLSNLCCNPSTKLKVAELNVLQIVTTIQSMISNEYLNEIMLFLLRELCNTNPILNKDFIQPITVFFLSVLEHVTENFNTDFLSNILSGLSYISGSKLYQLVDNTRFFKVILPYCKDAEVATHALTFVNNIIANDENAVLLLINLGLFEYLTEAFDTLDKYTYILKVLSNLSTFSLPEVHKTLISSSLIPHVFDLLQNGSLKDNSLLEAHWTIANYVYTKDEESLAFIVQHYKVVEVLAIIIQTYVDSDAMKRCVAIALMALINVLKFSEKVDFDPLSILDTFFFEDLLEQLSSNSTDRTVQKRSQYILDHYYIYEDDEM